MDHLEFSTQTTTHKQYEEVGKLADWRIGNEIFSIFHVYSSQINFLTLSYGNWKTLKSFTRMEKSC